VSSEGVWERAIGGGGPLRFGAATLQPRRKFPETGARPKSARTSELPPNLDLKSQPLGSAEQVASGGISRGCRLSRVALSSAKIGGRILLNQSNSRFEEGFHITRLRTFFSMSESK
jgi:hypothetical protein